MLLPEEEQAAVIATDLKKFEAKILEAWFALLDYHHEIRSKYPDWKSFLRYCDIFTLSIDSIAKHMDPGDLLEEQDIVYSKSLTELLKSYEESVRDFYAST